MRGNSPTLHLFHIAIPSITPSPPLTGNGRPLRHAVQPRRYASLSLCVSVSVCVCVGIVLIAGPIFIFSTPSSHSSTPPAEDIVPSFRSWVPIYCASVNQIQGLPSNKTTKRSTSTHLVPGPSAEFLTVFPISQNFQDTGRWGWGGRTLEKCIPTAGPPSPLPCPSPASRSLHACLLQVPRQLEMGGGGSAPAKFIPLGTCPSNSPLSPLRPSPRGPQFHPIRILRIP